MAISEEKVKEFLGNEENLKAIASDEEFLKKVSGGMATAETYKEEFKKFGIDLSAEEAKKVEEETKKYLSMPPEKLQKLADDALGGIAGGSTAGAICGGALGTLPFLCTADFFRRYGDYGGVMVSGLLALFCGSTGAMLGYFSTNDVTSAPSQPTYKVPEYNSIDYYSGSTNSESTTANPYDSIKK